MRCTRRAYASPRRKPSSTIGKISPPPPLSLSLSLVLGLTRVRLISPLHSSRAPNLKWADVCEVDVRDGTRQTRMASRDGEARPLMDLPLSLSLSLSFPVDSRHLAGSSACGSCPAMRNIGAR
jgi:hypothetical protein